VIPATGSATGFRLDGRVIYAWWGPDADGYDCIAGANGGLYTFSSAEECRETAASRGWTPSRENDAEEILDFSAAQEWLRGTRTYLDPVAALELWNWAADVAHSAGLPWDTRQGLKAECYDKLFAANVPWFFGMDTYVPRWNPRQIVALRVVLERAVRLLRQYVS